MRNVSTYKTRTFFSESDDTFIRQSYIQLSCSEMGQRLNRTAASIKRRVQRLGLKLTPEEYKLKKQAAIYKAHQDVMYSDDELNYIKQHYATKSSKEIAKTLNRSIHSVRRKACELGISKTPEYMSEMYHEITKTEGYRKFIRPSQSLTDKYILTAIFHQKYSEENLQRFAQEIKKKRDEILAKRNKAPLSDAYILEHIIGVTPTPQRLVDCKTLIDLTRREYELGKKNKRLRGKTLEISFPEFRAAVR